MEFFRLTNGLLIPKIIFGTSPLLGSDLIIPIKEVHKLGCNGFDTAYLYNNEADIATAFNEMTYNRSELFVSSKICATQFNGRSRFLHLDRKSVAKCYNESCKRIGVDFLDCYLLHSPFNGYIKAYKQLIKLYQKGSVKCIGISNANIEQLEPLVNETDVKPHVNQVELHPFNQQNDLHRYCQQNGIQLQAYSPFGGGKIVNELLTNKTLCDIANHKHKTVFQVILRWIIQRGIVAIFNSKNHYAENLDIFDFSLSEDEMKAISQLDRKENVHNYAYSIH